MSKRFQFLRRRQGFAPLKVITLCVQLSAGRRWYTHMYSTLYAVHIEREQYLDVRQNDKFFLCQMKIVDLDY